MLSLLLALTLAPAPALALSVSASLFLFLFFCCSPEVLLPLPLHVNMCLFVFFSRVFYFFSKGEIGRAASFPPSAHITRTYVHTPLHMFSDCLNVLPNTTSSTTTATTATTHLAPILHSFLSLTPPPPPPPPHPVDVRVLHHQSFRHVCAGGVRFPAPAPQIGRAVLRKAAALCACVCVCIAAAWPAGLQRSTVRTHAPRI